MRKISKLVLLLLLVVAAVITMAACDNAQGNQPKVDEISVSAGNMPQQVYPQGQELDLSNGMLTVKIGEEVKDIPMTTEGITATGYDANKLGEQTITISYGGKTTQITVTVIDRMQVIEFEADYLVGDTFDNTKGRLKITKDEGGTSMVDLSAQGVTVTGFDSSKTGEQTLTVKYNDYTTTFKVTVYAVESVTFHAPKKTNYNSHDAGLDLNGGYFTLTGNNGALTKDVPLTEAMITGFDLTAVNEENSPVTQELTVKYNGTTETFNIKLTYSIISLFKDKAPAYGEIDWSGAEWPEITPAMGETALTLLEGYLDLSEAEKANITISEVLPVARAALLYGMDLLNPILVGMEGAFRIEYGSMEFTCTSREGVEAAIEILENEDGDLYRISPILYSLTETFANEEFCDGISFGEYALLPVDIYEELLVVFEHLIETDDLIDEIGLDWKTVGIDTYASEVEALYNFIFGNDYANGGMAYIYAYVFTWRAAENGYDDVTEALFYYYYQQDNKEALNNLPTIGLPGELAQIAYHLLEAMDQISILAQQMQTDTTLMLYHYYMADKLVGELKAGDNEFEKTLYEILPVNALLGLIDNSVMFSFDTWLVYVCTMEGGFYQYCGALLGVNEFENMLAVYLDMVDKLWTDETFENTEEYGETLEELFSMYVALDPTQQYYCLNTLNAMYSMSVPPLAFDDSDEQIAPYLCFLVKLFNEYYRENLGDDADLYDELVIAMEIYANRISRENWTEEFTTRMDAIKTRYDAMNPEQQANFDRYLGEAYTKYIAIRENYVGNEATDLGEWADEFAELDEALDCLGMAAQLLNENYPMYSLYFTAYERAIKLTNNILKNAPEAILNAFKYEHLYGDEEQGQVKMSYEYVMGTYRTMYINFLLTLNGGNYYDMYIASDLPLFMDQAYDVIWAYMLAEEGATLDKDAAIAAMTTYRGLTLDEQILFIMMEGDYGQYYTALSYIFKMNYGDEIAAVTEKIMVIEQYWTIFNYAPMQEYLDELDKQVNGEDGLKAMYEALSDEDKAAFAELMDLYNFYVEAVNNAEVPEVAA